MLVCLLKLYLGSKSKLKEGLPQECQIACLCALSGFQDVCNHMQKRSISVTELQKIKDNHEQMKRLYEAATAHGDSEESGQLSFQAVNSALSQIMEEFKVFEERRSHLSHLCSNIPDVVQGKVIISLSACHWTFSIQCISIFRTSSAEEGAQQRFQTGKHQQTMCQRGDRNQNPLLPISWLPE